jgi:hypothetical protein
VALASALAGAVLAGATASAHRRDELLQAARIAIDPTRVELQLDLTPGIEVADDLIADIDRDGDGVLSADEKRGYVAHVSRRPVVYSRRGYDSVTRRSDTTTAVERRASPLVPKQPSA